MFYIYQTASAQLKRYRLACTCVTRVITQYFPVHVQVYTTAYTADPNGFD